MDELCPQNPNELESATFTSRRSFLGPTRTFASWDDSISLEQSENNREIEVDQTNVWKKTIPRLHQGVQD